MKNIIYILLALLVFSSCRTPKHGCICDANEWDHFLHHHSTYKEKIFYKPTKVYKYHKPVPPPEPKIKQPKVKKVKPPKVKKVKVKHHRHLSIMTKVKVSYSKD